MMNGIIENKIIKADLEEIYARGYDWKKLDGCSVLITGAYGMLASYIAYFLLFLRENKSIKVDILLYGRNEKKASARFGEYLNRDYVKFIKTDILSERTTDLLQVDYVIHAAGIANPRLYGSNPVEVIEPSVIGTYMLLKSCNMDRLSGFLYLSTCDIYGKLENIENITEETMGVMDPLDSHSCYGESRRLAETLLVAYYREYGIRTLIARVGHTYGPTMDIYNDPRSFASFMKCAVCGEDIVLHSDGLAQRPFCYISDAVAGYMLLLLNGNAGEAYNVTNTDQMISIREIATLISKLPEKNVGVVYREREKNDSYQQDTINIANKPIEDKLKKLGWKHNVDVKDGFSRVYSYISGQELHI